MSKSKAKKVSKPKSKQSSQKPLDEEALDQVSGGTFTTVKLTNADLVKAPATLTNLTATAIHGVSEISATTAIKGNCRE
jgi:hypothetical protein